MHFKKIRFSNGEKYEEIKQKMEGKRYLILFVDPKGTELTDEYRKIDDYSKIFGEAKNGKNNAEILNTIGLL